MKLLEKVHAECNFARGFTCGRRGDHLALFG